MKVAAAANVVSQDGVRAKVRAVIMAWGDLYIVTEVYCCDTTIQLCLVVTLEIGAPHQCGTRNENPIMTYRHDSPPMWSSSYSRLRSVSYSRIANTAIHL